MQVLQCSTLLLSTIIFIISTSGNNIALLQTIAVRGQVKCGPRNVINTIVRLGIDIGSVNEQILAITKTNLTGWFELKATVMSSARILRPFFRIDVNQSGRFVCHQSYKQLIPNEFVARQGEPERWYDTGIAELQNICSHPHGNGTSCPDFFFIT